MQTTDGFILYADALQKTTEKHRVSCVISFIHQ